MNEIREIENTWIGLSDGSRLAARVWMPADAEHRPVPAILDYVPYRKNDESARRDILRHPYFAAHGYAAVRVDLRGSGDSDGILRDEYTAQEHADALEVLAWIAAQPWCTGEIGMIGISWGGFNGLQIASLRPPQLKAVISLCSTDDRYRDDVHYIGGTVLGSDMLSWATLMMTINGTPPDPRHVGDRWREMWLDRLANTPHYIATWLAHQRRDAYWKHGSVCEDFGAIECPVYMVGGWADGYHNAVLRFLEGATCPRKGLIGPWGHDYPEVASPGPRIGFLQECLRWWDRWLKGIDTGVMDEPMLRVWMQGWVPAAEVARERPGRWVATRTWPSPDVETRLVPLDAAALGERGDGEVTRSIRGVQAAGIDAGNWCPGGAPADFPPDQRAMDGLSVAFTSEPLAEAVEILGFPEVDLEVSSDRPIASIVVRLCDVADDGSSLLVSRGVMNLTHRDSDEDPTPLVPGQRYRIGLRLNAIAHRIPAGHRVRVGISPTYFPWIWPSPESVTLTVVAGATSQLRLPVRSPGAIDEPLRPFDEPVNAPPPEVEIVSEGRSARTITYEQDTGITRLDFHAGGGRVRLRATGIELLLGLHDRFEIVDERPLSAVATSELKMAIGRGEWQTRVETHAQMWSDAERFFVANRIEAFEGDERVFIDEEQLTFPRDLV